MLWEVWTKMWTLKPHHIWPPKNEMFLVVWLDRKSPVGRLTHALCQRWRQRGLPPSRGNSGPLTRIHKVVMDCWKYCKGYKFALSVARPRAKNLSASRGTPLGALPQDPRYRLTLAMCPPSPENCPCPPPCSSTLAPALPSVLLLFVFIGNVWKNCVRT